jgi:hypothetical protein
MTAKIRATLKAENITKLPDNVTAEISPADLRGQLDDVIDSAIFPEDGGGVSDDPYDAAAWDGIVNVAPSKNAVRDKIESIVSGGGGGGSAGVSDTPYDAATWDGVTTVAPSKNAVRDKIESLVFGAGYDSGSQYDLVSLGGVPNAVENTTAFMDFQSQVLAAEAAGQVGALLTIPPGKWKFKNDPNNTAGTGFHKQWDLNIKKTKVVGYGATLVNDITTIDGVTGSYIAGGGGVEGSGIAPPVYPYLGVFTAYTPDYDKYLIDTVNTGYNYIHLKTSGKTGTGIITTPGAVGGDFKIGEMVMVGSGDCQFNGGPPNLQYHDYVTITGLNVTGNLLDPDHLVAAPDTILFEPPLSNIHLETYPEYDEAILVGTCAVGKARVWKLNRPISLGTSGGGSEFDVQRVYEGFQAGSGGNGPLGGNRIDFINVKGAGFSPTMYGWVNFKGCKLDGGPMVPNSQRPPWVPSHAYAVGNKCANDTGPIKQYNCTTAGTSAASGGPTGTGASITDGTAVWQYLATAPAKYIPMSNQIAVDKLGTYINYEDCDIKKIFYANTSTCNFLRAVRTTFHDSVALGNKFSYLQHCKIPWGMLATSYGLADVVLDQCQLGGIGHAWYNYSFPTIPATQWANGRYTIVKHPTTPGLANPFAIGSSIPMIGAAVWPSPGGASNQEIGRLFGIVTNVYDDALNVYVDIAGLPDTLPSVYIHPVNNTVQFKTQKLRRMQVTGCHGCWDAELYNQKIDTNIQITKAKMLFTGVPYKPGVNPPTTAAGVHCNGVLGNLKYVRINVIKPFTGNTTTYPAPTSPTSPAVSPMAPANALVARFGGSGYDPTHINQALNFYINIHVAGVREWTKTGSTGLQVGDRMVNGGNGAWPSYLSTIWTGGGMTYSLITHSSSTPQDMAGVPAYQLPMIEVYMETDVEPWDSWTRMHGALDMAIY